jgi:hypothetical protein
MMRDRQYRRSPAELSARNHLLFTIRSIRWNPGLKLGSAVGLKSLMSEAITENYRHVLIRFSVDTGRIVLDFNAVKVALYGDTEIIETDGAINKIDDVWEHQSHLQRRLLGRNMTGFVMDEDSFCLNFEDGAMIRAKNKKAWCRSRCGWNLKVA